VKRVLVRLACIVALLAATSGAHAELPKRNVPDYDGVDEPTTVGDVLLWVPRVVLSPLYLVSEYVVRRPLGYLVSEAEFHHVPEALIDLFLFGEDHKAGVLPVAFLDFGFYPSLGLLFFWNDLGMPGHNLTVRASTWGEHWLAGNIADSVRLDAATHLIFELTGVRRPDYAFFGIGSNALDRDLSRYGASRLDGHVGIDVAFGRGSGLQSRVGLRSLNFHHGGYDGDPTIEQQVERGRLTLPDGFTDGYTMLYERLSLAIDTRRAAPASGSGVRAEAYAEELSDVRQPKLAGYFRYGFGAGAFYDLNDHGRVVSLSLAASFSDPLGNRPVPFTELATLGGSENMRGFLPGRLWGRSAAVATVRYRWPIWVWLDGSLQFAVGNVFDKRLENFAPRLLRFSAALGIESTASATGSSLELLVGLGTETFEHGTEITSARVVLGSNHGF
jgi:hypothetical protein